MRILAGILISLYLGLTVAGTDRPGAAVIICK